VSSLYRCRARVGYRPAKSSKLIVFDERQIQELNVKLKWQPNKGFASADKSTEASAATSALDQSTCSVTISDPYLTGLAWPALFDAAMLYTQASVSAANNIILPACEEGQDPIVDKCAKSYVDTEVDSTVDQGGIYPFLLLSLWYDVKGTSFGTDFYFRVSGFSVSHGTRYPSVTIRGVEARSVIFNQSLINTTLEEGVDIDKALKDLAERQGFSVSFCANTNTDPSKKRLLPRSVRYTGITTDEAIKKVLDSVNGNLLSMPTREYANKISMCSRGEVNQGCSVFYLGKGLYEGYEISGQPDLTVVALNSEIGGNANNADPYVSEAFKASTYTLGNIAPNKRKKAMEKVKKLAFPELFKPTPAHIKNAAVTTGYVWRDAGPVVINEEATKVEKSGLNLFGIAPNGTTAISFFNGEVVEADSKNGRVDIKTKWSLQICEKGGSQKCFFRPIHQESSGLATVKIKAKDKVAISQEIGTSTTDKPEFVKFYIVGHGSARVTLNPQIVWDWAFPEEELPKPATPAISSNPANNVVPSAPKKQLQDWQPTTAAKPKKVLLMAGHADFPSGAPNERELNIELVKWAQRNAGAYGVTDFIEIYLPSSSNISASDPRSQFSKTSGAVSAGTQVIEIHNDEAQGSSGVIPPRNGNKIWSLDGSLASSYGAFSKDHRDGLGLTNRGGTILEVGRMDGATTKVFTTGTSAQKEALYKQLMDPVMRSIATEKTRAAGAAATTQSNGAADSGGAGTVVGRVGSTGKSAGPHVHIQESTSKTLSESQLRTLAAKYVTVSGKSLTSYPQGDGFGAGRNHGGLDYPIKEGEPISVTGKIIAAGAGVGGGDCGNGLAFQPPEGPELLICHLMDKSIPPNIAGLTTSSGGGKTKPTIQGSPAAQGLMLETGFKGVPRALRIIPGRTILSMITNYDEWVEENRPTSIDPGVWIPKRFKNWFVSECDYRWRDGDLRVQIEGVSAWGNTQVSAPTFDNYIKGLKDTGDIKITNTYYDYIRSLGGLNWITEDGKDSTEVHCKEAQELSQALSEGSDSTTPADSSGSFPASGCKTGDPNKDAIINGLYSAGLKTKNALAGALGNMTRESGLNSNVHNGSSPGTGCSTTPSRILGRTGYGLVQWCGSRADELATKYSCGRNCSLTQQLSFLQYEFGKDYKTMVSELNNAKSAGDAADIFMRKFERPKYPDQEEPGRRKLGEEIVKQIKCDKPA
jgi:hypothetical protein